MHHKMMMSLFAITCLFSACSKNDTPPPDPVVPPPTPPEVVEHYVYAREGNITLAIHKTEAARSGTPATAIQLIKDDLRNFSTIVTASATEKWKQDTIWIESSGGTIIYNSTKNALVIGDLLGYHDRKTKTEPGILYHFLAKKHMEKYLGGAEKSSLESNYNAVRAPKYAKAYGTTGLVLVKDAVPDASKSAADYFAELTEAYLSENNYYPFDYHELQRHDPTGFSLMEAVWGKRSIAANSHGISLPPISLKQWLEGKESNLDTYYRKYIDADGFPIVASRFVADSALVQTKMIVQKMLTRIPEAKAAMLKANFRVGVIGAREKVTDMPENRMMNIWWPGTDWDARGRGYGATEWLPLMTCGEENIIKLPGGGDRYLYESIMVHEFAHNVDYGLRKARTGFEAELLAAFAYAKNNGLWSGTYSMENDAEYFAEGVQAWFDTCNMYVLINGVRTKLKTREQLRTYDTRLFDLLSKIMPTEHLTGYHFTYE
ncbi:hypothetical protein [Paraflavitalea pollutisoli]|uniref:hypothetical protein n=1 Tax=Paraflavitalea pollutisoli TaxID=3034143 RepID=UPI0023ED0AC6|nr:hypothetical protein [Paraflavitalea sp. H1-2-19X]